MLAATRPALSPNALAVAKLLQTAGGSRPCNATREASGLPYAAFQLATGELNEAGMLEIFGRDLYLRGEGFAL